MLGEYLKKYMDEKGIKQVSVSEKTGIPPQKLGRLLKDEQKMETKEYFKICKAVEIDPMKPVLETGIYSTTKCEATA